MYYFLFQALILKLSVIKVIVLKNPRAAMDNPAFIYSSNKY